MSAQNVITLGDHEYPVVPQRIGYLHKKLGDAFSTLGGTDPAVLAEGTGMEILEGGNDLPAGRDELTGGTYRLLKVLIPGLMPEHEFTGFPTQEAFRTGWDAYDEQTDRSPNAAEIVHAFRVALKVNQLDLVRHIGKVVPAELLKTLVRQAVGDSISTLLQSSLSPSGDSGSTTPSPKTPTSTASEGSRSLDSLGSSTPEPPVGAPSSLSSAV